MSPLVDTWPVIIDRIFEGFLSVDNAEPDWLEVPGTGLRLRLDVLYPELGIAFWFKDSLGPHRLGSGLPSAQAQGTPQQRPAQCAGTRSDAAFERVCAEFCHQAGIRLIVVEGEVDTQGQTLAEIRSALSAASRRIALQRGAQGAKIELLPHIASARAMCQQILDDVHALPPERERGQGPQGRAQRMRQASGEDWQVLARDSLVNLGSVLRSLLAILKRLALFGAVLLVVNAISFLVTNYLDLRGPMAYNYVPDTRVPIADVIAPYPDYLGDVLRGDFGIITTRFSSGGQTPVLEYIAEKLPRSLVLLGTAVLFSMVVGITAGFLSVNYRTQRTNPLALVLSLAGFSMPGFYLGVLILYLIIRLAMARRGNVFFLPTMGYGLDKHLILPVLALSARPTAEIARLTAELLGEELPKDYIRVARAKGLPEEWVIMRHAFRNVVAAVINAMSSSWSYLIGSLVIVERVFGWRGMGEALLDAVTFSQFAGSSFSPTLVAGLATATALLFLLPDLATGLIAQVLDPRLRRTRGGSA
jgi:peptide/nickel transport system permease protein